MNKQEFEKQAEALYTDVRSFLDNTFELIDQIDEPEKPELPEIPQYVADWIEQTKRAYNLYWAMVEIRRNHAPTEVREWFHTDTSLNSYILARAWLDGYTVEKAKLYTVEIPDPDGLYKYIYLYKHPNGVTMGASGRDYWKTRSECQLTEAEIKEDFEWAWNEGFAKPVEVD